jgi:hypothetical protein
MFTARGQVAAIVIAIMVGAVVAATARTAREPSDSSAYATLHCTRYDPHTAPDLYCGDQGPMADGGNKTDATALRNGNYFNVQESRSWALEYIDSGGHGFDTTFGTGYFGAIGSSGTTHAYASCAYGGNVALWGQCETDWH